jgi:hypothetical protein
MFDLPLLIIFGMYFAFHAPHLGLALIPLNSLVLSWMIIRPIQMFLKFRHTKQISDLTDSAIRFALTAIVLGGIAILWIPRNIISQKEAGTAVRRKIETFKRTNYIEKKP